MTVAELEAAKLEVKKRLKEKEQAKKMIWMSGRNNNDKPAAKISILN
jgi:hypothetical protein